MPDVGRFLEQVQATADAQERRRLPEDFAEDARRLVGPVTTDTTAFLFYLGPATRVTAAGDCNGWNPSTGSMLHVPGTDFDLNPMSASLSLSLPKGLSWVHRRACPDVTEGTPASEKKLT